MTRILKLLVLGLMSSAAAQAASGPAFGFTLHCNAGVNHAFQDIDVAVPTRPITQADIDAGTVTSPLLLGTLIGEKSVTIADVQIKAKVFGGHPSMDVTLPNGTFVSSGADPHGVDLRAQLLLSVEGASVEALNCSLEGK